MVFNRLDWPTEEDLLLQIGEYVEELLEKGAVQINVEQADRKAKSDLSIVGKL